MSVINSLGRRKTSIARIYMKEGKGKIEVNNKDYKEYFPTEVLQLIINQPFELTNTKGNYDLHVNVRGGGFNGQAEAVRLAISKALVEIDEENRPLLKKDGLLTRDPRMVERKKYGKRKARRSFQFSKR
ncbi:30S ribosomal protein S9 [Hyphobacterium sp. CCMP332]|nr:30S ribosomal protein S9 [Hyphobacterium sp. CCMP332]